MAKKKYIDLKEKPVQSVVRRYMEAGNLTQDKFADAFNESLINSNVNRVSVSHWINGKYEPDMRLLFECLETYRDWRAEWARDCLRSMWHDLFLSGVVRVELPKAE